MAIMTRMKRLFFDYEQIQKNFTGHKYIIVTPVGDDPPDKYHVTYFVKGIYLLPDGNIETLDRHEVDITLHSSYPYFKPLCRITTPIWHPNFRNGQICIGDIHSEGESLTDIIINIGNMIQYKLWNAYDPISIDAAKWAMENKHLFPIGNIDLCVVDHASAKNEVENNSLDASDTILKQMESVKDLKEEANYETSVDHMDDNTDEKNFKIVLKELVSIKFISIKQKFQTFLHKGILKSYKVNIKTLIIKGMLWAFLGGFFGFILQESFYGLTDYDSILKWIGVNNMNDIIYLDQETTLGMIENSLRLSTGFFTGFIACGIGLFMGIGEGVFYGSKNKTIQYASITAGLPLVIGITSGYMVPWMYAIMLCDSASEFSVNFIHGVGWSIIGLSVGIAMGLIKPEKKRLLFCGLGGLGGGFIGGVIFNLITTALSIGENNILVNAIGIIIMALFIGIGISLLEQFAKQAWLNVAHGEFENKEYMIFDDMTSIGTNNENTIVLYKDQLVGSHHCDIILEDSKYILIDCGTPIGTIVNNMKITHHILKSGDTITVGNSVLVFHIK